MKSIPTAWPLVLCLAIVSACCLVHLAAAQACVEAKGTYLECAR